MCLYYKCEKRKQKGKHKTIENARLQVKLDVNYTQKEKDEDLQASKFSACLPRIKTIQEAKEEYERRLNSAVALNTKLLAEQRKAIIQLEKLGVDGPSRGTRSKVRNPDPRIIRDPRLAKLVKEKEYTQFALNYNNSALKDIAFKSHIDYNKMLSEKPNWNMERMAPTRKLTR